MILPLVSIISKRFECLCKSESKLEAYLRMFAMRAALCNPIHGESVQSDS